MHHLHLNRPCFQDSLHAEPAHRIRAFGISNPIKALSDAGNAIADKAGEAKDAVEDKVDDAASSVVRNVRSAGKRLSGPVDDAKDGATQLGGVVKGIGEGAVGTLKGLRQLVTRPVESGKGLVKLGLALNPLYAAVRPKEAGSTLKGVWDGITKPIVEDWKAGRYGEAVGQGIWGVAEAVVGTKGAGAALRGAKALGKGGKLDGPKAPKPGTSTPDGAKVDPYRRQLDATSPRNSVVDVRGLADADAAQAINRAIRGLDGSARQVVIRSEGGGGLVIKPFRETNGDVKYRAKFTDDELRSSLALARANPDEVVLLRGESNRIGKSAPGYNGQNTDVVLLTRTRAGEVATPSRYDIYTPDASVNPSNILKRIENKNGQVAHRIGMGADGAPTTGGGIVLDLGRLPVQKRAAFLDDLGLPADASAADVARATRDRVQTKIRGRRGENHILDVMVVDGDGAVASAR